MSEFALEILDGDRAGEVVSLTGAPLRIGRKPANDLVLADEKASGVHAEVVADGGRFVLRDLGSTNGTLMDGHRISEVVLQPGDRFQIGRVHFAFRDQRPTGAATGTGAAVDAMTVHQIDRSRVGKARSPRSLLVLLALVAAGAGAWFYVRQGGASSDGPGPANRRAPLAVAGNLLLADVASCEGETGWQLRVAGAPFAAAAVAHTGVGAFEARRAAGTPGAPAFACARGPELPVLAGRTLTVAAYVQTAGPAQIAVRIRLFSSAEQDPLQFVTGSRLQAAESWQRVEATAKVPLGMDRAQVEIVALLPDDQALAQFDDVAATEGGEATSCALQLESGQAAIGTGAAVAVRSTDPEQPALVWQLKPIVPAGSPLAELDAAGLCCLSDVGATVTVTAQERSLQFAVQDAAGVVLELPQTAQSGLVARSGDEPFAPVADLAAIQAGELLSGTGRLRSLLHLAQPAALTGTVRAGRLRLEVPVAQFGLTLYFRTEANAARELIQRARAATGPLQALDLLRELQQRLPHDTEVLAEAMSMRQQLLERAEERLAALRRDLDDALFFRTRGGFERVAAGLGQLLDDYGEHLPDTGAVRDLRQRAATALREIDAQSTGDQRERLLELAAALDKAGQAQLAKWIQDYVAALPQ